MKRTFKHKLIVCESVMFARVYHIREMLTRNKPWFSNDDREPIGKSLCGIDVFRDTAVPLVDYGQYHEYGQTWCKECSILAQQSEAIGRKDVKKVM
jgi:hypothetical protein